MGLLRLRSAFAVVCMGAALIVGVVAGTGATAGPENDRGSKIRVACANNLLTRVHFKTKPKHCIFLKRGGNAGVYAAPTKSMKWEHWGHPHARGRGKGLLNMLGATPVKVVLSKPVVKCGHRVYSKVKIRYPEEDLGGDMKLDTCGR